METPLNFCNWQYFFLCILWSYSNKKKKNIL